MIDDIMHLVIITMNYYIMNYYRFHDAHTQ